MKYRGVAYYPEFWPEERWNEDIRLMRDARINLVRIGEFAWAALEPAEGRLALDWLHRAVETMGSAGIDVMLCTPTATPPAWITSEHPDTLLMRKDGTRAAHGGRRHYCPTSEDYRKFCARITEALAGEFSRHANVVAWQIDNELGPEIDQCHCPGCARRFRAWLRLRYGGLDALNAAWQTRFWSVTFTDWDQVDIRHADGYPSIELDVRRFHSDSWVDFAAHQAAIIRRLHPSTLVTTNMMGPLFRWIDYSRMAPLLDVATMSANALACDLFRCLKPGKRFWVTETGSGALSTGRGPTAAQLRAWAFSAVARGSDAHVIFRWRTCPAGQEQDLQGILETSGKPRRRFEAVEQLFGELEELAPALEGLAQPRAEVAMVNSWDCRWASQSTRVGAQVKEHPHFFALHELLYDRNIMVDVVPTERDLAPYRLVVLPALCIVPPGLAERLREFVRSGGVVLATPQLTRRCGSPRGRWSWRPSRAPSPTQPGRPSATWRTWNLNPRPGCAPSGTTCSRGSLRPRRTSSAGVRHTTSRLSWTSRPRGGCSIWPSRGRALRPAPDRRSGWRSSAGDPSRSRSTTRARPAR